MLWLSLTAVPRLAGAHPHPWMPPDSASLEGRPIRHVEIRTLEIFDPIPPGRLAGFYRAANQLHVVTRPITVRADLLFRPGDPWSDARAMETARNLRGVGYLDPLRIEPSAVGDSVDVLVETRDHWTTSPEVNLESGGGQRYGTLALTEKNLFGLGAAIAISYREDPTGISRFISVGDGNLFGSRIRGQFTAGTGSVGTVNAASLGQPFYSEEARRAAGGGWARSRSEATLFQTGLVAARFGRRVEEFEANAGVGGRTPTGLVRRLTFSVLSLDRRLEPSVLEPGAPGAFDGGHEDLRLRRLALDVRFWRPAFLQRRAVEQFDRVEDFDVGPSASLKLGFAPRAFGSTADEGFAQLRLDGGADAGRLGFGMVRTAVSTRLRRDARETLARLETRWVHKPVESAALIVAAQAIAGRDMPRDFQAELGGLNGLRAYGVHALSGTQTWRLNAEQRWLILPRCWDLLSFGTAAFFDSGRSWGPGSAGAGWHHDAGFGIRLSLPHSALNQVARFDIAWPLDPTRDGRREPVFSFGSSQAF